MILAWTSVVASILLSGTVRAEASLEPIAHARVEVRELGRQVVADQHGYYAFPDLPAGRWTVHAEALGFRAVERTIGVQADDRQHRLDFVLAVEPLPLAGIDVVAGYQGSATAGIGPAAAVLDAATIDLVPAIAEADVFRTIQALPSVGAASDFSSALYVRGGSPDQTLVLLDGAPLFNPYHLAGLFAAVDPDAVANVEVLPGAFPARVGDRLSGVVSIWTRDGGRDRMRAHGGLGLVSSRAGINGPLPGRRGSYLVSVRRTYLDLFTDAAHALGLTSSTLPYAFTDAHLKLTQDTGAGGRLSVSGYVDDEGFEAPPQLNLEEQISGRWHTRTVSLHYRQPLKSSLLAEFRAATTRFGASMDSRAHHSSAAFPAQTLDARTTMRNEIVGVDLTRYGVTHRIRGGVQMDRYLLAHDVENRGSLIEPYLLPSLHRTSRPLTWAFYLEDEWSPVDAFAFRGGVRVLHVPGTGTVWMPRVGGRLQIIPEIALAFGAGRSAQAIHTLRDEESVWASLTAYDLLVAASPAIGLPTTDDLVLGLRWASGSSDVQLDGYIKRMRSLAVAPLAPDPYRAAVLAEKVQRGAGTARGLEVLARHRRGEGGLWASYSLAWTERRVGDDWFPARWERRHTIDVLGVMPLRGGQVSARMLWGTGQPYTPAVGQLRGYRYQPANGGWGAAKTTMLLGEHNSARLPGYFRLDVGARKEIERTWLHRKVNLTPYLQIINVLNTRNPLWAVPEQQSGTPHLEFTPQIPFLPTFGIEWRF